MTFAIEYLRIDGWWEAGRGWDTSDAAQEDGQAHFDDHPSTTWRVRSINDDDPKTESMLTEETPADTVSWQSRKE